MCNKKLHEQAAGFAHEITCYLDEAFYCGARLATPERAEYCGCGEWQDTGECVHIADLVVFSPLYRVIMTPYGQPNYRVVYEEILMRLQEIPLTTHEKIAQYDTSLSGCKCPDWIERGGAYLYKLNGQYFTQCKHMAYIRAAVQPANQFIGQKAPEPPFCARPLPNLGAAA